MVYLFPKRAQIVAINELDNFRLRSAFDRRIGPSDGHLDRVDFSYAA